jgi:TatA/E family protein of Tat protein translocase
MFGIGMPEMLLILALALIVIGPKKLPDLAKSLGRAMREFKRATSDFKETLAGDEDFSDVKQAFDDIGTDIKDTVDFTATPTDKSSSNEEAAEKQTDENVETAEKQADEKQIKSESDDKLDDLKKAFDDMNAEPKASSDPEPDVSDEKDRDSFDAEKDKE